MSTSRSWPKTALVGVLVLISFVSLPLARLIPGYTDLFRGLPPIYWWMENAARPLVPVVVGLFLLHGVAPRAWAQALGLDRPLLPAALLAMAVTTPMTILPPLLGIHPSTDVSFLHELFGSGVWPLAEELNFRGFAFGQIYLYSGLGFWPAGLLTSALFGMGHMANAAAAGFALGGQLMNAGVVGVSALALAWLYLRWNRNLWVVFFLHGLGNLGAAFYMSGDVAVGDKRYIVLLVMTLALALVVTLFQSRFSWADRVAGTVTAGADGGARP